MNELINEIMSEEEFDELIAKEEKPIIIDFWATWCNPCRMQTPIIEEFAEELKDKVRVVKVNVDENEKLSFRLGIRSIPTIMLYKGGEMKEKSVGLTAKASLSEMAIKYL